MNELYPYETTGTIQFNPNRGKMKTRIQWWCVLQLDKGLIDYYRWFLNRHWWEADTSSIKREYHTASHGAHVSIIRGERPRKNIQDWGKFKHGEKISMRYSPVIRQVGDSTGMDRPDHFWFIDVFFPEYLEIREHFGLPIQRRSKMFRGHCTIARSYE